MKLEWSVFAQADREAIFDHIEIESPQNAVAVDSRIQRQVEKLMKFPEMGRPGRVENTRELVVRHTPYIVAYRVKGDTVLILRVLHGARLWPESMQKKSSD
jgi:toxin ParE1/3/4